MSYREVFAIAGFPALWTAQVLSFAGDQFAQVAIAILVYRRTHLAFLTALAYALTYLPPIAGGPLLSGLADLFPGRRVLIACDVLRTGTVGLMAIPSMPFALCAPSRARRSPPWVDPYRPDCGRHARRELSPASRQRGAGSAGRSHGC